MTVSLAMAGRTPGKAIIGLRVVNRDGSPLAPRHALVRVLAFPLSFLVLGLGFVGILFGNERRALHDVMAGTAVVYDWGERRAELPAPLTRWGGGSPHRLQARFGRLTEEQQAMVLGLDPIADAEETNAFLRAANAMGSEDYTLDDIVDRLRDSFGEDERRLGMRIANLGVVDLSIWARRDEHAITEQLPPDWRMVVFDLGSLPSDQERSIAAAAVLVTFWEQRAERVPLLIVIDEAHNVSPQSPIDANQALATEHAIKIAGEGRKFGKYLLLATQRPEKVHQNVVSQCDNLVLMRMNSIVDLEQLKRIFSFVPPSLIEQASGFGLGEGLVAGKIAPDPIRFKTGRRYTLEGGSDVPATWASVPDGGRTAAVEWLVSGSMQRRAVPPGGAQETSSFATGAPEHTGGVYDRVIGRRVRSVSMATWLAIAVLFVTVTSLVVASWVSLTAGDDVADDLSGAALSGRAAVKGEQVEAYLSSIRNQTLQVASGAEAVDAAARFTRAYESLGSTLTNVDAEIEEVAFAYRDEFVPELEAAWGVPIAWQNMPPTSNSGFYLQSHYVVLPDLGTAERRIVTNARDGSGWSEVHAELHPRFFEIAERLGLQDLAIVDPGSGAIVYSVAKGLDFATSLDLGPHSGSTLASVVRRVRDQPEAGVAAVVDFAASAAHQGWPVAYFAAPILDDSGLRGILVSAITDAELNNIMTAEGRVDQQGVGETGEVYLVARDGSMRSISRLFLEDPETYLAGVAAAGTATTLEQTAMAGTGTTTVFQTALAAGDIDVAFPGSERVVDRTNYLERLVKSAYSPLQFEGLDWTVVSEIESGEFDQPVNDFRRNVLITVTVFVIIVAFATVVWAARAFAPLRVMSDRLRRIHAGEEEVDVELPDEAPREFTDLAASIEDMLASLKDRELDLANAIEQRLDTARSLLPPAIAQRLEAGDRQVIDQIPQASIVVLTIDVLGRTAADGDVELQRATLERVIEGLDALATHHGLDRVKIVGDAYFAGCGLTQPFLDHAPRAVAFALEARAALDEIGAASGSDIRVSAGIHVGPVTSGLAGSARLVYDLWGDTVATAHYLARSAGAGEILGSEAVKLRLPPDIEVAEVAGPQESQIWKIVGYRIVEEATP